MTSEIPFYISQDRRMWGEPQSDRYAHVLPVYAEGLWRLAVYVATQPCDGVITIGYSVMDMWKDMEQVAQCQGISLPSVHHVVGRDGRDMYLGKFDRAKEAFDRTGITYTHPVFVEDYAEGARKIKDLHVLFSGLDMPVCYALLYASPRAKKELALHGIDAFRAIEDSNQRLFHLLESRRSSSMLT